MMATFNIKGLKKNYGRTEILKGIDLSVAEGEFVSLLGPSGSGKTTILRCIAGLERPDAGELTMGRDKLSSQTDFVPPEKRQLGMVFQNYAVWPHMTVFENVAFPFRVNRLERKSPTEISRLVRAALDLVRLKPYELRYPHELSGGQQQRVALARALAMSPRALLLDEPLSNLDAVLREELGAEIRRLQQELKLTTILVTHDRREALSLSDRIIVLEGGKIEAEGSPESLYQNPPTAFVASFISGGQTMQVRGASRTLLPRRWRVATGAVGESKIVSRIYLGNEYEYWAENPDYAEKIRFFAPEKIEIGKSVALEYEA